MNNETTFFTIITVSAKVFILMGAIIIIAVIVAGVTALCAYYIYKFFEGIIRSGAKLSDKICSFGHCVKAKFQHLLSRRLNQQQEEVKGEKMRKNEN